MMISNISIKLGTVAKVIMGQAPLGSTYNEKKQGVPLIAGAGDLGDTYPNPSRWTTNPTQVCQAGDLIFCVRATIGMMNWADKEYCLGRGVAAIRPNRTLIEAEYLYYYLIANMNEIMKFAIGSTFVQVRRQDIEVLSVVLPPLPEQRRIVAILREADEIRQLRQRADEKTQEIVEALFYDMFGDPEINSKKWEKESLSQLGILDRGRSQHRPRDAAHLYGGPYPFIQTGNIANSNGWITNYTQTYSEAGLNQSRLWPKGTLCITIAANIAKTAVLAFDACFPDSIVGFTPGPQITIEYIRQWFVIVQNKLEQFASQAAQKNINLEVLRNLVLPVPPRELQDDFSIRVQDIYITSEEQKTAREKIENIISSHLSQAFTGELTSSWREQHAEELAQVARERDALLQKQSPALIPSSDSLVLAIVESDREDILELFDPLQQALLDIFVRSSETYFTAHQLFEDYEEELQRKELYPSLDHVRREILTLSELGLIREMTLPITDQPDYTDYPTVYRYQQSNDHIMSEDLESLKIRGG